MHCYFLNPKLFFRPLASSSSSCVVFIFLSRSSVRLKEYAVALSLSLSRREEDCKEEEGFHCS